MKRILLILLACFIINNYFLTTIQIKENQNTNIEDKLLINDYLKNNTIKSNMVNNVLTTYKESEKIVLPVMTNNATNNYKRNYNYLYYINNNNYIIKNQNDIKQSIYNGLNEGKDIITLYCLYEDNDNCLNDFYSIYKNKQLMTSINNYVSPYNKYTSTKYRININKGSAKIELTFNKKYTNEQIKEINNRVEEYLSQINLTEMNDIEKIKWAHDFIINRNKYDEIAASEGTGDAYNAYGAIIGNKAICQGYTDAMAIFLDKFNIPNIMISNGIHIWNLVNIDGKWLHIDTTWDDPITTSGRQIKRYDYYLVTSNQLSSLDNSKNHQFESNYYLESLIY